MVILVKMKRLLLILFAFAAVSCVGQLDDDGPDNGGGEGGEAVAGAGIVLDFTATWCVNCPRMHEAIDLAMQDRPGKIIPISVHFQDEMVCDAGKELIARFGVEAYPSLVANFSPETLITATSRELILAKLDAAASGVAPCGLEGAVSPDGSLTLRVTAAQAGEYTLGVALLEDGIVAAQTGGSDHYVHNNVLRAFLQENPAGDPLGQLAAGQSAERVFQARPAGTGTFRAVAFVCHGGTVNTAVDIPLP